MVTVALALVALPPHAANAQPAPGEPAAPGPASTASATYPLRLEPHLLALEDSEGQLSIGQVRSTPDRLWHATGVNPPYFGFSPSVWWLRFELRNPDPAAAARLVELAEPMQDYVDLYVVDTANGTTLSEAHTGDRRPFDSRPVKDAAFVFPVTVPAQGSVAVFIRIATYDGLHTAVPLLLWDAPSLQQESGSLRLTYGLYYGGLLALLLYNLLLYASTRDRLFGIYVLYLASVFTWNFTFRGFSFQYFWPDSPWLQNQVEAIANVMAFSTITWFTAGFLNLERETPRLNRAVRTLAVLQTLMIVPLLWGSYLNSYLVIMPANIVVALGLLAIATVLLARGSRPARIWLLAWSAQLVGVIFYYLKVFEVLPTSTLTEHGVPIGSALEIVLLAFGLAARMNQLKAEKLAAEREVREAATLLNERLETQVRQRTRELEAANDLLAELAVTDELTGAFNRRHFNKCFAEELQRQPRSHGGLALALFDVDHFKAYNDRYGHPMGDQVLKQVTHAVGEAAKRSSDKFFRVGGEEFALLVLAGSEQATLALVESARRLVSELAIPHEGSPHGHVTVSIGLIYLPAAACAYAQDKAYARADELLYQAKSGGRDRVCEAAAGASLQSAA